MEKNPEGQPTTSDEHKDNRNNVPVSDTTTANLDVTSAQPVSESSAPPIDLNLAPLENKEQVQIASQNQNKNQNQNLPGDQKDPKRETPKPESGPKNSQVPSNNDIVKKQQQQQEQPKVQGQNRDPSPSPKSLPDETKKKKKKRSSSASSSHLKDNQTRNSRSSHRNHNKDSGNLNVNEKKSVTSGHSNVNNANGSPKLGHGHGGQNQTSNTNTNPGQNQNSNTNQTANQDQGQIRVQPPGNGGSGRAGGQHNNSNNSRNNNTNGVVNNNNVNNNNNGGNSGNNKNSGGKNIGSQSGSTISSTKSQNQGQNSGQGQGQGHHPHHTHSQGQGQNQNSPPHQHQYNSVPSHFIQSSPYNSSASSHTHRTMLKKHSPMSNVSTYSQHSAGSQQHQHQNQNQNQHGAHQQASGVSFDYNFHNSGHLQSGMVVKSQVGFDRSRSLRLQVEKAIRERRVFSCFGVFPAIRRSLLKRGWIEKNPGVRLVRSTNLTSSFRDNEYRGFEIESDQAWMTRVLRDYPPDFVWVLRRDNIDWRNVHKEQLVNRHPRAYFTTKVGITWCIQSMQWFSEPGISETYFPRCYRLCMEEEKIAFIDDFRLCACMGLLKWVVGAYDREGENGVMDARSTIGSFCVDFATRQVNNYVRMRRHEDLDWLTPPNWTGSHWDVFLSQYYSIVILKNKLAPADARDTGKAKYEAAKRALQRVAPFWPQLGIDGVNNTWICKPGARSRGKGIVLMNKLDKILELLAQSNSKESNWVVQKYIERPLLVYKTKFDIRQWFIVSDWAPLTVWFYKECYIRFCTKPFSLDDFHESIHLCNNAVQCRYQNEKTRDSALPNENMWDNYTFQAYLKSLGKMELWDTMIYPGMKQGILGIILASQESVDIRKGCFELYGADFMLSEDFRPWLIEINSSPCMAATTNVTARMCNQCLEDTIKVIVDRKDDKNCSTGMFELIYKANASNMPFAPYSGSEYAIIGNKLLKDVDWPSIMTKYNSKRSSAVPGASTARMVKSSQRSSSMVNGMTFRELITRLRLKDAQANSPLVADPSAFSSSSALTPFATLSGRIDPISSQLENSQHENSPTPIQNQNQSQSQGQSPNPNQPANSSSPNPGDPNNGNTEKEKVKKNNNNSSNNAGSGSGKGEKPGGGKNGGKTGRKPIVDESLIHQQPIVNAHKLSSYTNNVDPDSGVTGDLSVGGHRRIRSSSTPFANRPIHRGLTTKEQAEENHKVVESLTETLGHRKGQNHGHGHGQSHGQSFNNLPLGKIGALPEVVITDHNLEKRRDNNNTPRSHSHLAPVLTPVPVPVPVPGGTTGGTFTGTTMLPTIAKTVAIPTLPVTTQGTTMTQPRIIKKEKSPGPEPGHQNQNQYYSQNSTILKEKPKEYLPWNK